MALGICREEGVETRLCIKQNSGGTSWCRYLENQQRTRKDDCVATKGAYNHHTRGYRKSYRYLASVQQLRVEQCGTRPPTRKGSDHCATHGRKPESLSASVGRKGVVRFIPTTLHLQLYMLGFAPPRCGNARPERVVPSNAP